jgi:NAD(P)-dependent dehydrogenase (short-subunit alcohol dehydrogenase family)
MKLLYDINVHGVFYTAREAARLMIPQGGGSIILVSSMSANVRFMSFTSITAGDQSSSFLYISRSSIYPR